MTMVALAMQQGQRDGSQQGLALHPTRLFPYLRQFGRILDLLHVIAQLTRASRR
jgi:hypothetical protein